MSDTLQPREAHSVCTISIGPTLTEVIMFGGIDDDDTKLADTTVVQFSEWRGVNCGKGKIKRRE